ncbi:MAG: lipoyl(octanoyl) transferase LipB [Candidatus Melainabacteria bacterium]
MLQIIDFGLAPYEAIWQMQHEMVAERLAGEIPDTLLVGEHEPVYTAGRKYSSDNPLLSGEGGPPQADRVRSEESWRQPDRVRLIAVERGGEATYHGPGQLIAYPIVALTGKERDLHAWLRRLEQWVIDTLAAFDVEGLRNPGWTGVWVRDRASGELKKIASIGVAVKQRQGVWTTYHGVALNVTTDLTAFSAIHPCGLDASVMTNLAAQGISPVTRSKVQEVLTQRLMR